MPEIQPQVKSIDLSSVPAVTAFNVVDPNTWVSSVYIANLPAGVTYQLAFGGKNPFQVYNGWFFDAGPCNWIAGGITLIPSAPLAGQSAQVMVIPYVGGSGQTVGSGA